MTDQWIAGAEGAPEAEDWVAQARPGPILGLIGFMICAAGLMGAVVWPQLWVFGFRPWGFLQHVTPPVISLFGVAAVPLGALIASGRLWAAIASVPVLIGLLVTSLFWLIYTLMHGMLSPIYLFAVLASGVGLVVSIIGVGLSMRVHRARQALLHD